MMQTYLILEINENQRTTMKTWIFQIQDENCSFKNSSFILNFCFGYYLMSRIKIKERKYLKIWYQSH